MNLDYEINGMDEALEIRVRADRRFKREIRDILGDASKLALSLMMKRVPKGRLSYSGKGNKRTIFSSLARSPITYSPGAAGGGGFYEMEVGAINDPPEHLDFVFYGTRGVNMSSFAGKFGDRWRPADFAKDRQKNAFRAPNRRRGNHGKLMAIQKLGEPVKFRQKREGQKPQQAWFHEAMREANAFVAARIQRLGLDL